MSAEHLLLFSILVSQALLLMDLELEINWQIILSVGGACPSKKKNCSREHGKICSDDESKMGFVNYLINTASSVNKALDHGGPLDLQH